MNLDERITYYREWSYGFPNIANNPIFKKTPQIIESLKKDFSSGSHIFFTKLTKNLPKEYEEMLLIGGGGLLGYLQAKPNVAKIIREKYLKEVYQLNLFINLLTLTFLNKDAALDYEDAFFKHMFTEYIHKERIKRRAVSTVTSNLYLFFGDAIKQFNFHYYNFNNLQIQKTVLDYYIDQKVQGVNKVPSDGVNGRLFLLKDSPIFSQLILKKFFTNDTKKCKISGYLNFFDLLGLVKHNENPFTEYIRYDDILVDQLLQMENDLTSIQDKRIKEKGSPYQLGPRLIKMINKIDLQRIKQEQRLKRDRELSAEKGKGEEKLSLQLSLQQFGFPSKETREGKGKGKGPSLKQFVRRRNRMFNVDFVPYTKISMQVTQYATLAVSLMCLLERNRNPGIQEDFSKELQKIIDTKKTFQLSIKDDLQDEELIISASANQTSELIYFPEKPQFYQGLFTNKEEDTIDVSFPLTDMNKAIACFNQMIESLMLIIYDLLIKKPEKDKKPEPEKEKAKETTADKG